MTILEGHETLTLLSYAKQTVPWEVNSWNLELKHENYQNQKKVTSS